MVQDRQGVCLGEGGLCHHPSVEAGVFECKQKTPDICKLFESCMQNMNLFCQSH